ncbi:MAG: hypothetical protein H6667_23305 [Ardenticatenaceae bacterium]|nr:hypothetical protein [Ardenticatenaceae bacterium]MCB9445602.1 hypothetical protein [Ardenticatenaceae bacterium]
MSQQTREIRQRWIITGTLELLTPAHLSNGDVGHQVDLTLLTDPLDGRPLLTGASLAGALRNYLNEFTNNYSHKKDPRSGETLWLENSSGQGQPKTATELLFGAARQNDEGDQSPLIVHDALGKQEAVQIERRDGVRIDPKTRLAADQAKFDLNLLAAGTQFDLCFELVVTEPMLADLTMIEEAMALALYGLQDEQISLGGRKRRGYGVCKASEWRLWKFDLTTAAGLKGWLEYGRFNTSTPPATDNILTLLKVNLPADQRDQYELVANFNIDGSVLIRSGFESDFGPDMAHLESRRNGQMVPILSGTSLAGVIRGQALRIARTVSGSEAFATNFVQNLFGYMPAEDEQGKFKKSASRVWVQETEITGGNKLVQNRVAIDRFTGGALESALFAEQPVFGGQANIQLTIKSPQDAEIGLLMLVLKDLWTGFVPIGGEASVGRGRLQGTFATIKHKGIEWQLDKNNESSFVEGDAAKLEGFVAAFVQKMKEGGAA